MPNSPDDDSAASADSIIAAHRQYLVAAGFRWPQPAASPQERSARWAWCRTTRPLLVRHGAPLQTSPAAMAQQHRRPVGGYFDERTSPEWHKPTMDAHQQHLPDSNRHPQSNNGRGGMREVQIYACANGPERLWARNRRILSICQRANGRRTCSRCIRPLNPAGTQPTTDRGRSTASPSALALYARCDLPDAFSNARIKFGTGNIRWCPVHRQQACPR